MGGVTRPDGRPTRMRSVRAPSAAGHFYPAEPDRIVSMVDGFLDGAARGVSPGTERPSAIVVPHAGYRYSGRVAASAYVLVRDATRSIRRVVLLGPAHFVPLDGCAVPNADAWRTPLGDVPIDREARVLATRAGAAVDDVPHDEEHSLEVQVPFLQRVVGEGFVMLPIAVGRSRASDVAEVIEAAATLPSTLVVVSTDLSHYHPADAARSLDERTARAVVGCRPEEVRPDAACGRWALLGLLERVRRQGSEVRLLDLRTSADAGGGCGSVVGYGAFAVR